MSLIIQDPFGRAIDVVTSREERPGRNVTLTIDHQIQANAEQVLARTVERFRIPRDVIVVCVGKSTYARCGIIVNVTPLEPEWEGIVTLEVSNTTPLPARIYAGEGIAQVLFFEGDEPCETSYADKKGKYQAQTGLTLPRLEEIPWSTRRSPSRGT